MKAEDQTHSPLLKSLYITDPGRSVVCERATAICMCKTIYPDISDRKVNGLPSIGKQLYVAPDAPKAYCPVQSETSNENGQPNDH